MRPIEIHPSAKADISRHRKRISVIIDSTEQKQGVLELTDTLRLLQQMEADPELKDLLLTPTSTDNWALGGWVEQQRKGRNLWKLKAFDGCGRSKSYRIIYAFQDALHGGPIISVLAIVHRDEFDYENGTTILTARILGDYDALY